MPRISKFTIDDTVEKTDKLIGSNSNGVTKNFEVDDISKFFKETNAAGVAAQLTYKYDTSKGQASGHLDSPSVTNLETASTRTIRISVYTYGNTSDTRADLIDALSLKDIIIVNVEDPNNFGIYNLTNIATSGNYKTLTLSVPIAAKGSFTNTKTYAIAAYGGGSGDLTAVQTSTSNQLTVTNGNGPIPSLAVVTGAVSNNGAGLATQAQIKTYVDAQIATEDTIAELNDTTIGTLANGHLLLYDNDDSIWENKALSGDATITKDGALTLASSQTNIAEMYNTGMTIGRDAHNKIYFNTDNEINFVVDFTGHTKMAVGKLLPVSSNNIALGDSTYKFKELYLHGGSITSASSSALDFTITTASFSNNVNIDGTLEADAITVNSTALNEYIADTTGAMFTSNTETFITATYDDSDNTIDLVVPVKDENDMASDSATHLATQQSIKAYVDASTPSTITVAANNSTDETVYPLFVDGATGAQDAETDTGLTYNPSTGLLTSTGFSGNLTGTLQTAAQGNITSLGTLTTLSVDNITINGNDISSTDSDGDILFKGNDGGSTITALTLDMSDAGSAIFNNDVKLGDGGQIQLGADTGGDMYMYHDGTHGYIFNKTGDLYLGDTNGDIYIQGKSGENSIVCFNDEGVYIYYNAVKKFETTSAGATVTGTLTATSLDISGDADIDGTLEADAITVNGTALNTVIAGVTVTNATNAAHVLVTDNESTDEENLITFVEGATSSTGNVGLEMDGNLTYNPSSGRLTSTSLSASGISATNSLTTPLMQLQGNLNVLNKAQTSYISLATRNTSGSEVVYDLTNVGNVTTSGYLRGPSSFTIDPATHGDDTGTVVIAGNLQVDGTTTTINSTTVAIDDLNFSIATDAADSAAANGAGITIGGASATLIYTHATTSWDMNKPLNVTGNVASTGDMTIAEKLIHSGDTNTYLQFNADDNLKLYAGGKVYFHAHDNGNLILSSNNSTALTLDTSQNATFAGDVTVTGGDITLGTDSIASNINAVGDVLAFKVDSNENTGGTPNIQFKVGSATELTINGSSATFAGLVSTGGATNATGAAKLHVADGTGAGLEVIPQTGNDRVTLLSYDRNSTAYQTLDFDGSDIHFNISGSEKMRLDSSGNVELNGTFTVGVDDTGYDVKFFGATSGRYMLWDESADKILLADNVKLMLGTGNDVELFHDGTNSKIDNRTGNLTINNGYNDGDIIFSCDDGSGGEATYFYLDGSETTTIFSKNTEHQTSVKAYFGASANMSIWHDGNNGSWQNDTGHMYIRNTANNSDIYFLSDDGNNNHTEYFWLDGGEATYESGATSALFTIFPDKSRLTLGTGKDLQLYHNATDSIVQNLTGDLYFINHEADKDIVFQNDDGSGGTATYFYLDGSGTRTIFEKLTRHIDDVYAAFGTDSDLRIYHDGSNSYIKQVTSATGDLIIEQDVADKNIIFKSDDGSGGTAEYFRVDGANSGGSKFTSWPDNSKVSVGTGLDAQFYHSGSHTYIENNTGNLEIIQNTDDGDIIFASDNGSGGTATYLTLDGGITSIMAYKDILVANDGTDGNIKLGASQDLVLNHDGTNSFIINNTGVLYIRNNADDNDICFQSDNGSGSTATYFFLDGDNVETTFLKRSHHMDSVEARFGDGNDLKIYHDSSNSYVDQIGTGDLILRTSGSGDDVFVRAMDDVFIQPKNGEAGVYVYSDGAVELYYDNAKKFETTSTGVTVTGDILAKTSDGAKLTLQTSETTVVDGDVLGRIDFQAPDESDGTDAILVGASIWAEADATFAADQNTTELVFATGASEAATEKVRITSDGKVGINTATPSFKFQVEDTTASDNKTIAYFVGTAAAGSSTDDGGQFICVNRHAPISQANGVTGGIAFGTSQVASGAHVRIQANYKYNSGRDMQFLTSADNSTSPVERMVIKGGGDIGIGTNSPSGSGWDESAQVLHIYKNSTNGATLALESSNTKGILAAGDNKLSLFTTTDDQLRIGTSGTIALSINTSQIPTFQNATASGTAMYIYNTTDSIANTKTLIDFRAHASDNSTFYVSGQMGSKAEGTWTSTSSTRDASLIFNTVLNGNNELALTLASDKTATFTGQIHVAERIVHTGDTDTYLRFVDNNPHFFAGGVNVLDLQATETAFTGDTFQFLSANSEDPVVQIKNSTNDAFGSRLRFNKDRGAAGQDGDLLGMIDWIGKNDAGSPETIEYARIQGLISDASDGAEGGKLRLGVASHDGDIGYGLVLTDGDADGEVDVTIGSGASSLTTVAGTATFGGTITATTNGSTFGNISVDRINLGDNEKIIWGGGSDLQIYHQSSDNTSYIFANNTNPLKIATETSGTPVTIGHTTSEVTIGDNLTVTGDLTVSGTTTTLNTQTVEVEDNILQLNTTQGSPDTATATTSGISVYRGDGVTQASLIFDDADDTWDLTNNLTTAGNVTVAGNVTAGNSSHGQVLHGSKAVTLTENTFTTALTVNLAAHTACYVKIFVTGDWSGHSAVNYLGEYFLTNGNDDNYNEPGMIIREVDNTKTDTIVAKIVDPAASGTQNFIIQLKADDTVGSNNVAAKITYEVMGQYVSVT